MIGHRFSNFIPDESNDASFKKLLPLFLELLTYTSGDVPEALDWMTQLDQEHKFTDENYGMGDFINDLKKNGYLQENEDGVQKITPKAEQSIRKQSLEDIFGKLKKSGQGSHRTFHSGSGEETTTERRNFEFGDRPENIIVTDSLKNSYINHGIDDFMLLESDLEIDDNEFKTQTSTVLMIDISHSMILYGEDRITPAKKVAMALSELITTRYPKDTLDIIAFGNDAWPIKIKDLPYLEVGPFHTNTVAGLELAMDILRRKRNSNKQIFMITDGKPTCLKEGIKYYQNSFGLDRKIINKTIGLGAMCNKAGIKVTTFMIARDPYLQQFVAEFTEVCQGKAFYSSLHGLGEYVFHDYEKNRKKRTR